MKLRVKDLIGTILVAAVTVPYVGYLINGEMPFIQDPRGMSATGIVLGAVAFLVMRRGDLFDRVGKAEPSGQRRQRPARLHADKAYDSAGNRAYRAVVESRRGLPGAGSSHQSGWDGIAGRSGAPCRGWVDGGGSRCGGIGTRGGSSPSRWWLVPSSAATGCEQPIGAIRRSS